MDGERFQQIYCMLRIHASDTSLIEDDTNKQGQKTSSKLVDTFVEHLVKAFVDGQLHIGDWSTEKGAPIDVSGPLL